MSYAMIDNIEEESIIAEMNVMDALMNSYMKEAMMLDYVSSDVIQECFYQEGEKWDKFKDDANAPITGKQGESVIKKILMFIPRLITAFIRLIKSKFNKDFINALREDIAEAKEHVKNGDFDQLIPGLKSGKMHFDSSDFDDDVFMDDSWDYDGPVVDLMDNDNNEKSDTVSKSHTKHGKSQHHTYEVPSSIDVDRLVDIALFLKKGKIPAGLAHTCGFIKTANMFLDEIDNTFKPLQYKASLIDLNNFNRNCQNGLKKLFPEIWNGEDISFKKYENWWYGDNEWSAKDIDQIVNILNDLHKIESRANSINRIITEIDFDKETLQKFEKSSELVDNLRHITNGLQWTIKRTTDAYKEYKSFKEYLERLNSMVKRSKQTSKKYDIKKIKDLQDDLKK